jgi:nucleotide-binding universal stress UspA family protein/hemerythrin-like domain-containing protein
MSQTKVLACKQFNMIDWKVSTWNTLITWRRTVSVSKSGGVRACPMKPTVSVTEFRINPPEGVPMYRHLLVPIDKSELSTVTIGRAVEFARALGARITFFHAIPDFTSSIMGDAERVRLAARTDETYQFTRHASELLNQAEAAATAHGVPCASASATSDVPYTAIIDAARSAGCDLIFMASHGRRSKIGMMIGSQTLKVLVNADVPVLVSVTAEAQAPDSAVHASAAATYRHLLVPIDGSELSSVSIDQAVDFAFALGARITFFHATPDYAASFQGDAEIVRMTAPDDYAYRFAGRARELLTKAESAARARGVPCASASATSDSPYTAIVAAARSAGCDLIFMASHGRRSKIGMMIGSQTLKVLVNSDIPVLVSATTDPLLPIQAQAIGIIRDEHRSLAAVLHASLERLKSAIAEGARPDPDLMRTIVYYIKTFMLALHHPKEEEYLFSKLSQRTPQFDPELDELKRQHARDNELVDELSATVERYIDGATRLEEVDQVLNRYAKFAWEHMGREEGVILPAAQRHLTEEDWSEINDAFQKNRDPRFGGKAEVEFKHLFSRIVNLAPPASH